MDGCQSITCDSADCPEFAAEYTCQCNEDCEQYGNCCEDYNMCSNDPCSCPQGTGWDSDTMMCLEGSTTRCWECSDMDGCQSITCDSADCPEFAAEYTCQCNEDCEQYGNCCEDYNMCSNDPCSCPEGTG